MDRSGSLSNLGAESYRRSSDQLDLRSCCPGLSPQHRLWRQRKLQCPVFGVESKMFTSVAYDTEKRILYLRFQSGDTYRYFEFSNNDYQQLLSAESKAATS
jgi:hypothetical protein